MKRPLTATFLLLLSFVTFIILATIAVLNGTKGYIPDMIGSFAIIFLIYLSYNRLRITVPSFSFFIFSLYLHNFGVFGWYANSPLPLQWDHITHFVPIMAVTIILFQFARSFESKNTMLTIFLVLLASLGIGAVIETIEFVGFLNFGFGDGAFQFGGMGDEFITDNPQLQEAILEVGGGYFNTNYDLLWNGLGAIAGIFLMSVKKMFQ